MSDNVSPKAYHTVTPYLIVPDVPRLLQFLVEAVGATERGRLPRGRFRHACRGHNR